MYVIHIGLVYKIEHDLAFRYNWCSATNRIGPVRRSAAGLGLVICEEEAVASIANEVARMLYHLDGVVEVGDFSRAS